MELTAQHFKENVGEALTDVDLQRALNHVRQNFIGKRAKAVAALPEFEELRHAARDIKNHTLDHLDLYLEAYEARVKESGGHVHFAETAADARAIILDICRRVGARTVTKGKSMISEEIGLNDYLAEHGIEAIETDLGEYIVQLRGEVPSHIIAPAVHVNIDQVEADFRRVHTHLPADRDLSDPPSLLTEARGVLRERFPRRRCRHHRRQLPRRGDRHVDHRDQRGERRPHADPAARPHRHRLDREDGADAGRRWRRSCALLARSATGQDMSVYTTLSTGPRRPEDPDGPEEYHVVILDNGRTAMLGTDVSRRCCAASAAAPA